MGGKTLTYAQVFAFLIVGSLCFLIFENQNVWAQPGLRIIDQYAYLKVESNFENNVTMDPVCTERDDPRNRYTCAFANNKVKEIEKAKSIVANLLFDEEQKDIYSKLIELENNSNSVSNSQGKCSESLSKGNFQSCKFEVVLQERISIKSQKLTQIFEISNVDAKRDIKTTSTIQNNTINSETNEISHIWSTMKEIFSNQ